MIDRFRVRMAVCLFLREGNKVLLQKRDGTDFFKDWYGFPGGHVEANETLKDGMIREAKEEIAVDIKPEDLDLVLTGCNFHDDYISFVFACKKYEGNIKINEPNKCTDLRFFDMNDLPKNTIPYIRKWIESDLRVGNNYSVVNWEDCVQKNL